MSACASASKVQCRCSLQIILLWWSKTDALIEWHINTVFIKKRNRTHQIFCAFHCVESNRADNWVCVPLFSFKSKLSSSSFTGLDLNSVLLYSYLFIAFNWSFSLNFLLLCIYLLIACQLNWLNWLWSYCCRERQSLFLTQRIRIIKIIQMSPHTSLRHSRYTFKLRKTNLLFFCISKYLDYNKYNLDPTRRKVYV